MPVDRCALAQNDPRVQLIERMEGDFIISLDDFIARDTSYLNKTNILYTVENHNGYEGLYFTKAFLDFLEERGYNSVVRRHELGVPVGILLRELFLDRAHALELKLSLL